MSQKRRMIFLLIALIALLTIGRLATGGFGFLFADFWFSAGLFMLILGSVVDQPHFSKASNVFLNGTAGLLALLTIVPTSRDGAWGLFFAWSWYLVATSYLQMLMRTQELESEPRWLQLISRLNRVIGRPAALFSAFFLWGVHLRFTTHSTAYSALMWYWAVFMILDFPSVSKTMSDWLDDRTKESRDTSGHLVSFLSPRIVEGELSSAAPLFAIGKTVNIRAASGEISAIATVIDDRVLAGRRRVRLGITELTDQWLKMAAQSDTAAGLEFASTEPVSERIVSVVDSGSDIGRVAISVSPDMELSDGALLWVQLPDGQKAYYQIVTAQIREAALPEGHGLHEIAVTAGQLGTWSTDSARFSPITWVAPAGGLVMKALGASGTTIPNGCHRIGHVPLSEFPVHLDIQDVVTHNTAILGVTGSGKTFLAQSLVRGLLDEGIHVLILDITRQYWDLLASMSPQTLHKPADVAPWLSGDKRLGVYQFADSKNLPFSTAEFAEAALTELQSRVKLKPGVNEPARLCILLEEAHSLIPEWNQVATKGDSDHVNRTAKTVLQGRKFGLGCIVISQRTANVTKTILNQCNTIAALQCFDQTGLDFLENYMGADYARSMSTLPPRHAIVVGKASSSARPIRVALDDYQVG